VQCLYLSTLHLSMIAGSATAIVKIFLDNWSGVVSEECKNQAAKT
jgi:hypothetical protein